MKRKKTRAYKSHQQQYDDLKRAIEKHGDPNDTRVKRLKELERLLDAPF